MILKLESFVSETMNEIYKAESKAREKAANYALLKMKQSAERKINASPEHRHISTGNYEKGFYAKTGKVASFVGNVSPHNYLVEYGTESRSWKNGKSTGKMPPLDIVYGTLKKESENIGKILGGIDV